MAYYVCFQEILPAIGYALLHWQWETGLGTGLETGLGPLWSRFLHDLTGNGIIFIIMNWNRLGGLQLTSGQIEKALKLSHTH
jgi:hypothetical protein